MEYTPSPAFLEAAAYLSSAPSLARVSVATKLEVEHLYGLYKHLSVAPMPPNSRPSLFDMTGRAKWDAWCSTGKTYAGRRADAEKRYLDIAHALGWISSRAVTAGGQQEPEDGEEWDDDLGVSVPRATSAHVKGGMGGSVSAMPATTLEDGGSSLHALAIQGDAAEISRVLAGDALVDVNQRDEYGYTALHLACDRGNSRAVQALIKHGADGSIKDPDDLTGMELAQIAGHDEICAILQAELH